MGNRGKSEPGFWAKLLEWLGIGPSEDRKLDATASKLASERASEEDRLEALKEKLKQIQARAQRKLEEWKNSPAAAKGIVQTELERLSREKDRLKNEKNIIDSNLERIAIMQAKVEELKRTRVPEGLGEDAIDDMILDLQEGIENVRNADRAARELDNTNYEAPPMRPVDLEKSLGELTGTREADTTLPPELIKRLELENDDD